MTKTHRAFAFLFLVLFLGSIAIPLATTENYTSSAKMDTSFKTASTDYIVDIRVWNEYLDFNDDDFTFRVWNGTIPLDLAWVHIYNITTGLDAVLPKQTDGNGYAKFPNLPVGTYQWNVSHDDDPLTPDETGQIVSDGPEANVDVLFGNVDWENNDDDLNVTITDIEDRPAENLNFTIRFLGNNSIWSQVSVTDGRADFANIPQENYTWWLTVLSAPYEGYVLANGTFESDGTQLIAHQSIGPLTGDEDYLDMEISTVFETSLSPIVGADIVVTDINGTFYDSKVTPANGTVIFVDLPPIFINWTITYMGQPVGLGDFSYNLTAVESDVRKPVVTGPGDLDVLLDTENVTLTWTVEDEYPFSIEVWVDGELNVTTSWTESPFVYVYNVSASFPEFIIGYYEIELKAIDMNSNFELNSTSLRIYENVTPVIEGPDPLEFTFSETGYSLSWNVTDEYPNMYEIHKDDELYAEGDVDPDEPVIEISLDGLEVGVHNFSFFVNDTSGNSASDSVLVTVLGDTVPPVITYTPATIRYAQGDRNLVFNWTATDDFMDYYEILVDGVVVVTEEWTTHRIEFDFSGLQQGRHNVTLRVYDLGSNMAESTVMVIVGASTLSYYLTSFALVALGAIVLIGIVWFVRYR